jgi:hypothetical protein
MFDYAQICFVIMPFGRKEVSGGREVDFDQICAEIFEPAICRVPLPEGGTLKPRRADQDFFNLAEIRMYLDKPEEAPRLIREGIRQSDHDWQGETFLRSLELLEPAAGDHPGLKHCLEILREWKASGTI